MPIELLGYGKPEECVNHAKKVIDEMGDGFILMPDRIQCTRNDAKRENLLAINEFLRNTSF